MSKFIGKLDVECLGDRLYILTRSLTYFSDIAKQAIIVPVGFKTDLLSTWTIPFAAELFDGDDPEPAALHDYTYSSHMFTRAMSDAILREACIAVGTSKLRAWAIWIGVRIGGGSHW